MTDLRLAARRLAAAPGFFFAAALTLALGIGANTLTFSAIRGLLLRPLPFPQAERLVWIHGMNKGAAVGGERVDGEEANALASRGGFESVGAIGDRALVREAGGRPSQWHGIWVTLSVPGLLGVVPAAGRVFDERDFDGGAAPAMMMSYERWQSEFGGDPAVAGRVVRFADNKAHTVVGVLPKGLAFPFGRMPQSGNGSGLYEGVQDFWLLGQGRAGELPGGLLLGRLRPGVLADGAARDASALAKEGRSFAVVGMRDQALGLLRPALPLLQGFAGFVLLIACANLANLMLARAARGRTEFAVRMALGARAGDLLRIVMAESALLTVCGGAAGLLLAWAGRAAFVAMAGDRVALAAQVQLDGAVLAFTTALCLVTAIACGAAPATVAWNDAARAMLGRGRSQTAGRGQTRLLKGLVAGQVALSVVLLTGAGLLLQSLTRLLSVDAGYQRGGVVAANILLYQPMRIVQPYFAGLHRRLRGLPGVEAVGLIQSAPLTGKWTFREKLITPRRTVDAPGSMVAFDYFEAMRIPVLAGRTFSEREFTEPDPAAVIVNDAAARALFPGESAIGQRVTMFGKPREIVGVVKGTRDQRLDAPAEPQWYQPMIFGSSQVVVRTSGDPLAFSEALRRELLASDARVMVKRVEPLEAIVADSVFERRLATQLLTVFAGVALALALVGLYGVVNVATVQRRREFGIRAALGARPAALTRMVLRQGLGITAAGAGVGAVLSMWSSLALRGLLFEVGTGDPLVVAAVCGTLLAASLAACWWPARRAASADPSVTLRAE